VLDCMASLLAWLSGRISFCCLCLCFLCNVHMAWVLLQQSLCREADVAANLNCVIYSGTLVKHTDQRMH
jgi:hypothetical protein